jgi:hypothetical protein
MSKILKRKNVGSLFSLFLLLLLLLLVRSYIYIDEEGKAMHNAQR